MLKELGHTKNTSMMLILLTIVLATVNLAYAGGPNIDLPSDQVSMEIQYPSPNCYYTVILSDIPSGYHVSNGPYLGWCVDEPHYIHNGEIYKAKMYSTYDPNNPHPDPDWNKVNYILNHKQGDKDDIQAAIWYFVDGGNEPPTSAGQAMKNEAIANGENFVPAPGQVLAVVLWINDRTQIPIIEVIVPLQNVVPEYPLGPILGTAALIAALSVFKYKRRVS